MKKVAFLGMVTLVIVVLGLLIAPTPAMADSVDFGFTGGTISGTGPLTGSSSLTTVTALPSGTLFTGSLGTVSFTTGSLLGGSLASGTATFGAGGLVTVTANGTGGLPSGVIYSAAFTGTTTWTLNGTAYTLTGPLAGAISPSLASLLFPGCVGCSGTNAGILSTLTVVFSSPYVNSASISSGNINAAVPEPGSLALFGSGLIGIAGLIRRKLSS